MVKRLAPLVLAALALSAPAALAAGPRHPGTTARSHAAGPQQRVHALGKELLHLRRCTMLMLPQPTGGSGDAAPSPPKRCLMLATRLSAQLQKLDEALQARIAKLQATCGGPSGSPTTTAPSGSGKDPCANAEKRIQRLQALDQKVQELIAKLPQLPFGPTGTGNR